MCMRANAVVGVWDVAKLSDGFDMLAAAKVIVVTAALIGLEFMAAISVTGWLADMVLAVVIVLDFIIQVLSVLASV